MQDKENLFPNVMRKLVMRGRVLRSRVYQPAHQPGLAENGQPGVRYIHYQRERAKAGLGMQITGATPVVDSEVWANGITLVNADDQIIPGYRLLAQAVHEEGGLILAQLAHVGAMETSGSHIISASWGQSELTHQIFRAASEAELDEVVRRFQASAIRCRAGNLDGVEISMAHGMLLASFLSPRMNRRTDRYGGDVEGRTLFPRQILRVVREAIGQDRIVGIRIPGDELIEHGLHIDGAVELAARLVDTGDVDYVSVTAGNNTYKLARVDHWPPTPAPYGLFRDFARAIREAVNVPVATVGRVTSIRLAEDILASGDADLVGMVRANIADPEILPKTLAGQYKTVRPCVGANVCVNALLDHKPLICMVNPEINSPHLRRNHRFDTRYQAIVVGAGPAGLEAARQLALRGIQTRMIEQRTRIGGQMRIWSDTPSRREFCKIIQWWGDELDRLGVSVELGTKADAESIVARVPDIVVIATGSVPVAGSIDSVGSTVSQCGVYDAPPSGAHLLIRDEMGKLPALLTAERLAQSWQKVTLVTSALSPGEGEGLTTAYTMIRALARQGVRVIDRAYVKKIERQRVFLEGVFGEERPAVDAVDTVVSLIGSISENGLAQQLQEYTQVMSIGDAVLPRDVEACVRDAAATVSNWQPESA